MKTITLPEAVAEMERIREEYRAKYIESRHERGRVPDRLASMFAGKIYGIEEALRLLKRVPK